MCFNQDKLTQFRTINQMEIERKFALKKRLTLTENSPFLWTKEKKGEIIKQKNLTKTRLS